MQEFEKIGRGVYRTRVGDREIQVRKVFFVFEEDIPLDWKNGVTWLREERSWSEGGRFEAVSGYPTLSQAQQQIRTDLAEKGDAT